jgi:uncharacterized protein DUF6531
MRIDARAVRIVAIVVLVVLGIPGSALAQTEPIGQGRGSFFKYNAGTGTYAVNVNTGNLVASINDFSLGTEDSNLFYTRVYNSLDPAIGEQSLGTGWRDNFDIRLLRRDANTFDFVDGTGYQWRFRKQPDGTFRPDEAGFGTLTYATGTSTSSAKWIVTETAEEHRYTFYASTPNVGGILSEEFDYEGSRLGYTRDRIVGHESARIQTTQGPAGTTTFYANDFMGPFRLDYAIPAADVEATYTHGTALELVENPDLDWTGYTYNANGKLSEVKTTTGWTIRIAYTTYAGAQRVSSLEATGPGERFFIGLGYSAPDPSLCLATDVRMTTVTDQTGRVRRYCTNAAWKLTASSGPVDESWLDSTRDEDPEADDDVVPEGGYGDPEPEDLCLPDPDALAENYCGEDDIGPETEAYYNEPPLIEDGTAFSALAAPNFKFGISDQHLEYIRGHSLWEPLYRDLQIRRARLNLSWDAIPRSKRKTRCGPRDTYTLNQADDWVAAARALGQEMLISFNHSAGNGKCLPSVSAYYKATKAIRERYPDVKLFTAWNEPMHSTQPTEHSPRRAGRFWRNLNWQCKNQCVVAAGDFDDGDFKIKRDPKKIDARDWLDTYKEGMGHSPRIWAWHAYRSGKTRSRERLRAFLRATNPRSKVWITEAGAVYHFAKRTPPNGDLTLEEAGERLEYLLDELGRGLPRVTRFYHYQWVGDEGWDSGLVDRHTGQPRNLYTIFKDRTNPSG